MDIAHSINGVPIRLTDERWTHIVENHDEMAGRLTDVLEVIEGPGLDYEGESWFACCLERVRAFGLLMRDLQGSFR